MIMKKRKIQIFDTTLRDGEQAPGFTMDLDEKVKMAAQLELLGADVIEAGFPISSESEFESVKAIARKVTRSTVAALSRAKKADIDRTWEALRHARKPRIHTFIATSEIHMMHKLKKTPDQVLQEAVWAVRYARTFCDDVEFSAEDATRSDLDFLCRVIEAVIDAGATVVNIPDTVGYSLPWEFGELIATIRRRVPNIDRAVLSVHCHDDLGMAVANSLAAIRNGAGQVECTINGIGERAGNAALEEIVMAMQARNTGFEEETGIEATLLYPTSQMLCEITGTPVQINKAVVGRNAFSHEAGIHQDGMLKNPMTYEIMTPQSVGVDASKIVLGKHSGRNALNCRLRELGFHYSREELDRVYLAFINMADRKKNVGDKDLIGLTQQNGFAGNGRRNGTTDDGIRHTVQDYLNKQKTAIPDPRW